jgi:hypothetical protein
MLAGADVSVGVRFGSTVRRRRVPRVRLALPGRRELAPDRVAARAPAECRAHLDQPRVVLGERPERTVASRPEPLARIRLDVTGDRDERRRLELVPGFGNLDGRLGRGAAARDHLHLSARSGESDEQQTRNHGFSRRVVARARIASQRSRAFVSVAAVRLECLDLAFESHDVDLNVDRRGLPRHVASERRHTHLRALDVAPDRGRVVGEEHEQRVRLIEDVRDERAFEIARRDRCGSHRAPARGRTTSPTARRAIDERTPCLRRFSSGGECIRERTQRCQALGGEIDRGRRGRFARGETLRRVAVDRHQLGDLSARGTAGAGLGDRGRRALDGEPLLGEARLLGERRGDEPEHHESSIPYFLSL